ncbi:PilZ domain-containing protein [Acuticoccus mangrovi]|uniref:PilZ domain-containing protein n=1 Tax=Acuticoccus mangrovi TaxID=2796142 RepID=A0A934MFE7_9HYPH|nr:PilZ domain-containing protein [Acuticoccus mangrovi]MBJ3778587.1 PilZ domain-containing protein [Acuticoccus mangrovi]
MTADDDAAAGTNGGGDTRQRPRPSDEAASEFAFGYGGWSVTYDSLAMLPTEPPASAREVPAPKEAAAPGGDDGVAPAPPQVAASEVVAPVDAAKDRVAARREGRGGLRSRLRVRSRTPEPLEDFDDLGVEAAPQDVSRLDIAPRTETPQAPPVEDEGPVIAATRRPAAKPVEVPPLTVPRPRGRTPRPGAAAATITTEPGQQNRRAQRIDGGGTVMIEDQLYSLIDWSTGGIAIRSEGQLYRIGDARKLELEIDLGDYAVNLDIDGEVVNRSSDRTGWRFVAPSETQRQVLRALTHAALHGRPFNAPRAARARPMPPGATEEEAAATERAVAPKKAKRPRRFSPIAALMSLPFNAAIIGLVASVVILTEAADRVPGGSDAAPKGPQAVRAEHAAVAVKRIAVDAGDGGLVLEWAKAPGELVAEGEPIVSLVEDARNGARKAIVSPCDCYLARILVDPGERVAAGGQVALLYPRGSEGHVQALFASGNAPNLGDEVNVDLPYSGDRYTGVVESVGRVDDPQGYIGLPPAILDDQNAVFARIRTTPAMPAALAGDPAIVTVPRPEA